MSAATTARQLDSASIGRLEAWLAREIAAETVDIAACSLLAGGAVQENWRIDAEVVGGPLAGRHVWVMRSDAPVLIPVSLDRTAEFQVVRAAHAAGVKVAEPVARCEDTAIIGRPFLVVAHLPGTGHARRVVRDPALGQFGESLARELAAELARIHAIRPPHDALSCLPLPLEAPARVEVARLRRALDGAGEPRPALEYILAWLHETAPPRAAITLVHGDFRTGNYMVDGGRLMGILDWEFAHWGDPDEDVGWLAAHCWRFGNDELTIGGIAHVAPFLEAYRAASGRDVGRRELRYWQIMAEAKWAVITVLQGDRYRKGGEARLELALTGLMAPEMELTALDAILGWSKGEG